MVVQGKRLIFLTKDNLDNLKYQNQILHMAARAQQTARAHCRSPRVARAAYRAELGTGLSSSPRCRNERFRALRLDRLAATSIDAAASNF